MNSATTDESGPTYKAVIFTFFNPVDWLRAVEILLPDTLAEEAVGRLQTISEGQPVDLSEVWGVSIGTNPFNRQTALAIKYQPPDGVTRQWMKEKYQILSDDGRREGISYVPAFREIPDS